MTIPIHTDEKLAELRETPKRVINPRAQWTNKPSRAPIYRQRSFKASPESDEAVRFEIYQREHLRDPTDFSCGIAVVLGDGSRLTLARYDGSSQTRGDFVRAAHPPSHGESHDRGTKAGTPCQAHGSLPDRGERLGRSPR